MHYEKLFKKGVFIVVDRKDIPPDALKLRSMWIFVVKPDKFSTRAGCIGQPSTTS